MAMSLKVERALVADYDGGGLRIKLRKIGIITTKGFEV